MPKNYKRSLQDVVGEQVYNVWVDMLHELVPDGQTYRLSVVIAGMSHYATSIAEGIVDDIEDEDLDENSVALSLVNANEGDPDQVKGELYDVVKRLFADAGVTFDRVSSRGDPYSVVDEAYDEFVSWYDYPWD